MKSFIPILIFLSLYCTCYAQNKVIDYHRKSEGSIKKDDAFSQQDSLVIKQRTIKEHYDVLVTDTLIIDHSFGDVHIHTWDRNVVAVEIVVTGRDPEAVRAQEIADNVFFTDDRYNKDKHVLNLLPKVKTPYNNNNGVNGIEEKHTMYHGMQLNVDYVIYVPKKMPLNISNTFGDVYADDIDAYLRLRVIYGEYHLQNLSGRNKSINYFDNKKGKSTIESIEYGIILGGEGSKLTIGKAGHITVYGYDTLNIGRARHLTLYKDQGLLNIGSVDELYGSIQNSNITIDNLGSNADLALADCKSIDIKKIGPEAEYISLRAKNSFLSCHFDNTGSLIYSIKTSATKISGIHFPYYLRTVTNSDGTVNISNSTDSKSDMGFISFDLDKGDLDIY